MLLVVGVVAGVCLILSIECDSIYAVQELLK